MISKPQKPDLAPILHDLVLYGDEDQRAGLAFLDIHRPDHRTLLGDFAEA